MNGHGSRIEVKNLCRQFARPDGSGTLLVLSDVSFTVESGQFVSIVGESGCGKTTLLRLIAGLDAPSSGSIQIAGEAVNGPDPRCGMMFQQNVLFPWLTVRQNVAFGPRMMGQKREKQARVEELLKIVGIADFADAYPCKLSGGMQQRAALARALANEPEALLLDEPLGALDAFTRMRIQDELVRIWQGQKNTMLMITHDIDEAVYLSNQIIIMSPRPGRVERILDVDMDHPRDRSTEAFVHIRNEILQTMHYARPGKNGGE